MRAPENYECLVSRLDLIGSHAPHDWWYTTYGGGHQLCDGWEPSDLTRGWDETEGYVERYHCLGT